MNDKIDNASYDHGRAAFANGASLRSIVELVQANDDNVGMSFALGFADALLDQLRKPLSVERVSEIVDARTR